MSKARELIESVADSDKSAADVIQETLGGIEVSQGSGWREVKLTGSAKVICDHCSNVSDQMYKIQNQIREGSDPVVGEVDWGLVGSALEAAENSFQIVADAIDAER